MTKIYNRRSRMPLRRNLRNKPTPAERHLWQFVRRRGVANCKIRRQHGVGPFTVDFFAAEVRLAIEVDGPYHNRPDIRRYDAWRQGCIEYYGIKFLRVTNDEVFNDTDLVLKKIEQRIIQLRR